MKNIIYYETLVDDPECNLIKLLASLGLPFSDHRRRAIREVSRTAGNRGGGDAFGSSAWERKLSRQQQQEVQAVLDMFGITMYSCNDSYPIINTADQ